MPRFSRIIPGALVVAAFIAILVAVGAWQPVVTAVSEAFGVEVGESFDQLGDASSEGAEAAKELAGDAVDGAAGAGQAIAEGETPELPKVDLTGKDAVLATLDTILVKGRAPMTGYDRDQFGPAWKDTDHNGCDTRNDVLDRDMMAKTFKPGTHDCVVLTGTLDDPYTGATIRFQRGQGTSTAVQIDHIVPLGYAWRQGAQQWAPEKREQFANDFDNLVAVDGPANAQKSDQGPASWLPSNKPYRCEYVTDFVEVAAEYQLSMPQPDVDMVRKVLESC